jgi:hypothetical protein
MKGFIYANNSPNQSKEQGSQDTSSPLALLKGFFVFFEKKDF